MNYKYAVALSVLAASACAYAANDSTIQVGTSPQGGEVDIGAPARPAAPSVAASATLPNIPLIGGTRLEPGRAAPVYTTMQSAAQAGVNPMAVRPAESEAASAPAVSTRIEITDETLLGRLAALPFLFKAGALLLLGIGGYALREWKRA